MSKYQTFQTATHRIKWKNNVPIKIKPFGDVHRDSHNCDVDRWKSWLKECRETHDEDTYYIGLGDYNDFASYSERKQMQGLHESTCEKMDRVAQADVDTLASELSFMKGHLLGLIHGNHEWEFVDGTLSTERLCEALECPFLGWVAYVRLMCKRNNGASQERFDIFASHGKGGGRLLGSTFNNIEKMGNIFPGADLYLMGHDHKRGAVPKTVLTMNSLGKIKEQQQWFGRTGSFLRGFVEDTPSYAVGAMYAPTSLGTISFDVTFSRSYKGGSETTLKKVRHYG